jgi:cytochrome c
LLTPVHDGVKSTKVPVVPPVNLSFLPGICWQFLSQKGRIEMELKRILGEIILNRTSIFLSLILSVLILAVTGAALAQKTKEKKTTTDKPSAAAVERGKTVFQSKCALCHYADQDQKKIGPGLKGLSKRGTFTVNNNKVTDENLKEWIENGDELMPPFKDALEPAQIKDVIAYVKTL